MGLDTKKLLHYEFATKYQFAYCYAFLNFQTCKSFLFFYIHFIICIAFLIFVSFFSAESIKTQLTSKLSLTNYVISFWFTIQISLFFDLCNLLFRSLYIIYQPYISNFVSPILQAAAEFTMNIMILSIPQFLDPIFYYSFKTLLIIGYLILIYIFLFAIFKTFLQQDFNGNYAYVATNAINYAQSLITTLSMMYISIFSKEMVQVLPKSIIFRLKIFSFVFVFIFLFFITVFGLNTIKRMEVAFDFISLDTLTNLMIFVNLTEPLMKLLAIFLCFLVLKNQMQKKKLEKDSSDDENVTSVLSLALANDLV